MIFCIYDCQVGRLHDYCGSVPLNSALGMERPGRQRAQNPDPENQRCEHGHTHHHRARAVRAARGVR